MAAPDLPHDPPPSTLPPRDLSAEPGGLDLRVLAARCRGPGCRSSHFPHHHLNETEAHKREGLMVATLIPPPDPWALVGEMERLTQETEALQHDVDTACRLSGFGATGAVKGLLARAERAERDLATERAHVASHAAEIVRLRGVVAAAGDLERGLRAAVEEARAVLAAVPEDSRAPADAFERALAALSRVAPETAPPLAALAAAVRFGSPAPTGRAPCPIHGFSRSRCDCASVDRLGLSDSGHLRAEVGAPSIASAVPTGSETPVLETPEAMAVAHDYPFVRVGGHGGKIGMTTEGGMGFCHGIRADRAQIRRLLIAAIDKSDNGWGSGDLHALAARLGGSHG